MGAKKAIGVGAAAVVFGAGTFLGLHEGLETHAQERAVRTVARDLGQAATGGEKQRVLDRAGFDYYDLQANGDLKFVPPTSTGFLAQHLKPAEAYDDGANRVGADVLPGFIALCAMGMVFAASSGRTDPYSQRPNDVTGPRTGITQTLEVA